MYKQLQSAAASYQELDAECLRLTEQRLRDSRDYRTLLRSFVAGLAQYLETTGKGKVETYKEIGISKVTGAFYLDLARYYDIAGKDAPGLLSKGQVKVLKEAEAKGFLGSKKPAVKLCDMIRAAMADRIDPKDLQYRIESQIEINMLLKDRHNARRKKPAGAVKPELPKMADRILYRDGVPNDLIRDVGFAFNLDVQVTRKWYAADLQELSEIQQFADWLKAKDGDGRWALVAVRLEGAENQTPAAALDLLTDLQKKNPLASVRDANYIAAAFSTDADISVAPERKKRLESLGWEIVQSPTFGGQNLTLTAYKRDQKTDYSTVAMQRIVEQMEEAPASQVAAEPSSGPKDNRAAPIEEPRPPKEQEQEAVRIIEYEGGSHPDRSQMPRKRPAKYWSTPCASDAQRKTKRYCQGGTPLEVQAVEWSDRMEEFRRAADREDKSGNLA